MDQVVSCSSNAEDENDGSSNVPDDLVEKDVSEEVPQHNNHCENTNNEEVTLQNLSDCVLKFHVVSEHLGNLLKSHGGLNSVLLSDDPLISLRDSTILLQVTRS